MKSTFAFSLGAIILSSSLAFAAPQGGQLTQEQQQQIDTANKNAADALDSANQQTEAARARLKEAKDTPKQDLNSQVGRTFDNGNRMATDILNNAGLGTKAEGN